MNAKQIIEEIRTAYPVDIFPEVTKEEREAVIKAFPGFIDRSSAMMGRHLADIIEEKLTAIEEVDDEVLCDVCGHDIDWHGHGGDCDWQDSTYTHMCMCQKTYEQVRGDHFQKLCGKLASSLEEGLEIVKKQDAEIELLSADNLAMRRSIAGPQDALSSESEIIKSVYLPAKDARIEQLSTENQDLRGDLWELIGLAYNDEVFVAQNRSKLESISLKWTA